MAPLDVRICLYRKAENQEEDINTVNNAMCVRLSDASGLLSVR